MNVMQMQEITKPYSGLELAPRDSFKAIYYRSGLTRTLPALVSLAMVMQLLIGATLWAVGGLVWSFVTWESMALHLPNQITRALFLSGALMGLYLRWPQNDRTKLQDV